MDSYQVHVRIEADVFVDKAMIKQMGWREAQEVAEQVVAEKVRMCSDTPNIRIGISRTKAVCSGSLGN